MAHRCPECMQIFENRISHCPLCDFDVVSDDRPEDTYLRAGYTRYRVSGAHTVADNPQGVHIDDDDVLQQIRTGYTSYVADLNRTQSSPAPNPTPAPPVHNPQPRSTGGSSQPNENEDFFGSFASSRMHTPEPQPEPEPIRTPAATNTNRGYDDSGNRNRNYYTPARHSVGVRSFFNGLGRFLAAVPWRVIFYIALAVGVIFGLYSLWQMRFAILESILSFIVALLPLGLIVAGIVALIRSMFR